MLREVRSLRLEDHDVGLVAVIDRFDAADGTVVPVDLKKGRPDSAGLPWPADRIQSLVQAMLLKRAGYRVHHGLLYYAETNQTVPVELTRRLSGRHSTWFRRPGRLRSSRVPRCR